MGTKLLLMSHDEKSTGGGLEDLRVYRLGWVYDGQRLHARAVLAISAGQVVHLGPEDEALPEDLQRRLDKATVVDLPSGLALPGLSNAHHHAYSALARGMPVPSGMQDFGQVLEKLWWPLDRSLTTEAVELSALVTAVDCVRHGVTTVADHHASPLALHGSLEIVGRAFRRLGLQALLCFEISDRYRQAGTRAALEENLAFAAAHKDDPHVRGLLGLHASFTLADDTLRQIAAQAPGDLPIHAHVAEDRCDVEHARQHGHAGPLARLASFGLLRPGSLIAHGVHLADEEISLLKLHDAFLVHNPESNLNNRVGVADLARFPRERVLLGTDGMGSNMLASLRAAFLSAKAHSLDPDSALDRSLRAALPNPARYFSHVFGGSCGEIAVGQPADFTVFDYPCPTPFDQDNLAAHLLFGLCPEAKARYVHAHGRLVVDNDMVLGVDEEALMAEARRVARDLWKKFEAG